MQYSSPVSAAENHTSFPDGAHDNPSNDSHPVDIARTRPERSTRTTSPRSSTEVAEPGGGRNMATCCPSGETRVSLNQSVPSSSSFPNGFSSRHFFWSPVMTARSLPLGDQSASYTFSSNSRGDVPPSGAVAKVPCHW